MRERMARKTCLLEVERVHAEDVIEAQKGVDIVVIDDELVGIRVILTHSEASWIIGREAVVLDTHTIPPSAATAVP